MSILEGDIGAKFRYNNTTGLLVPVSVTGELQTVEEFPEFTGYYGFTLNETPQTNVPGITQVMRVSDSQVFTHTTLSTIGTTEYFFDYSNNMPILFFNAANDGEEFEIQYNGVGGAVNGKNILQLVANGIENNTSVFGKIKYASTNDKTFNANVTLLAGIAQVRHVHVTANMDLYSNSTNTFGILEIFGNLEIDSGITLTLGRVLLIVHGNIIGSGTIQGKTGAAGGNGGYSAANVRGGGGGGAGGISLHIMCFGSIANTITIRSGRGGAGGLAPSSGSVVATAGTASTINDIGVGTGGIVTGINSSTGGGGGGSNGNGGNGGAVAGGIANNASAAGAGAGGGGGAYSTTGGTATATASAGGSNGGSIWYASGGAGGSASAGVSNPGVNGGSGNLTLYSIYTSAPCTVDVSATTGVGQTGAAGSATYNNLAAISNWLGELTQTYAYLTKAGRVL